MNDVRWTQGGCGGGGGGGGGGGPHSNNILGFIIKHSGKKLGLRYILVVGHRPPLCPARFLHGTAKYTERNFKFQLGSVGLGQ